MAEDPAPNNNGAQAPHPRQDVDVLLDVSELEVDLIDLEVEGLKAHVSVLASTPTCKPRQPAGRRRRQAGPGQARDRGRAGQAALEGPARQRARHPHPRPEHRGRHSEILRSLARALDELLTGRLGDALGTLESVLGGLEGAARSRPLLKGRLEDVRATLQEVLSQSESQAEEGVTSPALPERPAAGGPSGEPPEEK